MSAAPSHEHRFECRLVWTGATKGGTTSYEAYSRECRIDVPNKPSIRMTAAPVFRGDPSLPNPEDLLVASLSVCHFLSYVALCARARINVVAYEDDASGTLQRVDRVDRFTDVLLR